MARSARDTSPRIGVRGEHRLHFLAQRAVAGARPIEIVRTGRHVSRQRRMEHLGDLPPTFRRHAAARPAVSVWGVSQAGDPRPCSFRLKPEATAAQLCSDLMAGLAIDHDHELAAAAVSPAVHAWCSAMMS